MQKTHKTNLILTCVCVILVLLAIPKVVINSKGKNVKTLESALLNTKYLPKINSIYLGDSVDNLHFSKVNDNWLCTYGDLTFYAESKIVSELLKNFSKTRTLIKVSSDFKSHESYGLAENGAFNVSFYEEDSNGNKNLFSSIYFGIENSDRTMVYLRNDRKADVYSTQNDMYQYFNTRLETFSIMELLPLQDSKSENSVEIIEITDFTAETPYSKIQKLGDEKFSDNVHTAFSLRGATLLSEDILVNSNMKKLKSITLSTTKNTFYNLEIYSYTNGVTEEQYFVKTNFSGKNPTVNYVLEISSWTKSRLDFGSTMSEEPKQR